MARLPDIFYNTMLDAFADVAIYASLHTANPGNSGASEITGGSYARQSIPWIPSASGLLTTNYKIMWAVPAGNEVRHCGYWSALSSGTFYGSRFLSPGESSRGYDSWYEIAAGDMYEQFFDLSEL